MFAARAGFVMPSFLISSPLTGAKLRLTLREDLGDELAARRGDEPEELEADF